MKLVVGLGNPGTRYIDTRHNVGFLVVDRLAGENEWKVSKSSGALYTRINEGEIELFKPQKFMNKSGLAVKAVKKKHPKLENKDIYVIHDDLDIKLGEYKISQKGPRVHNGLKSIYEQIGSKDFWHVRVGVDNGEFRETGKEYVLAKWRPEEREVISGVINKIVKELENVLTG